MDFLTGDVGASSTIFLNAAIEFSFTTRALSLATSNSKIGHWQFHKDIGSFVYRFDRKCSYMFVKQSCLCIVLYNANKTVAAITAAYIYRGLS